MNPITFSRIIGIWMLLFSSALVPPIIISLLYRDGGFPYFASFLFVNMIIGGVLWSNGERNDIKLRVRDGFLVVVVLWFITSMLASIPFIVCLRMSPADAIFEAVSALTTTGATVITGLDSMPRAILFFRQELQWLGGIGVAVSAIALVPLLGIGGMRLLNAEVPGPIKGEKLAPRIAHTAVILWKLYLGMTILCAVAYWFAGMSFFDALAHSLSTVSTGGFSTHDASLAYFESTTIESIAVVFMLVGGINFSIHFAAWRELDMNQYWKNEEVRTFLLTVSVLAVLVSSLLYLHGETGSIFQAVRLGTFTVVSVITSTGYGITDFSLWGYSLPILLMFISFIGGCAGSTAGGIKVVRFIIMFRSIKVQILRSIYPTIAKPIKLQNRRVDTRTVDGVRAFLIVYVGIFVVLMVTLQGLGMGFEGAFSAVATCMNNLGPGLGEIASNFQSVSDAAKWVLSLTMLLGRLEVFALLVLFSPMFWKT